MVLTAGSPCKCCALLLCLTPSPLRDTRTCRHTRQVPVCPGLSHLFQLQSSGPASKADHIYRTASRRDCVASPLLSCFLVYWFSALEQGGFGWQVATRAEVLWSPEYVRILLQTLMQRWEMAELWHPHAKSSTFKGINPKIPYSISLKNSFIRQDGAPWHTWQVWNKHISSDLACLIQPGATGAKAVFYFHWPYAGSTKSHHKLEPLISTWKCLSLSQRIIESELLSVLYCPNNTLKNQGEKGSATSTTAAIWHYSSKLLHGSSLPRRQADVAFQPIIKLDRIISLLKTPMEKATERLSTYPQALQMKTVGIWGWSCQPTPW